MRRALVALCFAALLAGCGGSGGGESASTTATTSPSGASTPPATKPESAPQGTGSGKTTTAKAAPHPRAHRDSSTGTASFEAKGADNSIQESGSEASESEMSEAAVALHGYLDARAADDWAKACSYMAASVTAQLSQFTAGGSGGGKAPGCAKILASFSVGIPAATLRESAQAEVGALRVEGESAFLLFHGAHGADYFMPMAQEDGGWKVAAVAPSALG